MYKKAYREVYFQPGYALKRIMKNPKLALAGISFLKKIFFKKKQ